MESSLQVQVQWVKQASALPEFVWRNLEADQVKANIALPVLQKCRAREQNGQPTQGHRWIYVYTLQGQVIFLATCTDGYAGKYPIFLWTPAPYAYLHHDNIVPGLRLVASSLLKNVPTRRVYSVFGPEIVTRTFSNIWTAMTGIQQLEVPYYHALISSITRETFDQALQRIRYPDAPVNCRPATLQDIPEVSRLCYGFAGESPPFTLSHEQAFQEAQYLVRHGQVWVHTEGTCVATIVAFTRNTDVAATITKVYTPPEFRGQRRAEMLVRAVCRYLLTHRDSVSLFVGIGNRAANVYRRVGFVGLGDNAPPVEGVDPYVEIGFDRNRVELGHW